MSQIVDVEKAKAVLNSGMEEAKSIIDNPEKVEDVLKQVGDTMSKVPVLGNLFTELPDMISLVQSYITKENTDVSPKIILALVGSFLYLIKRKDLIPDKIPIIGMLDDIAVLGLALEMVKPELNAYRTARAEKSAEKMTEAPAEAPAESPAEAPAENPEA